MKYWKKMIAPLVIAVLCICFMGVYLCILQMPGLPGFVKWLGILFILGMIGTTIYVTIERVQEIRSGEEDDLSKY